MTTTMVLVNSIREFRPYIFIILEIGLICLIFGILSKRKNKDIRRIK